MFLKFRLRLFAILGLIDQAGNSITDEGGNRLIEGL